MQKHEPLTPTLSPSDGEREKVSRTLQKILDGDWLLHGPGIPVFIVGDDLRSLGFDELLAPYPETPHVVSYNR
jgi:hypothetical protein